jgi:hypothetical protein
MEHVRNVAASAFILLIFAFAFTLLFAGLFS